MKKKPRRNKATTGVVLYHPSGRKMDERETAMALATAKTKYERKNRELWAVRWQDPAYRALHSLKMRAWHASMSPEKKAARREAIRRGRPKARAPGTGEKQP